MRGSPMKRFLYILTTTPKKRQRTTAGAAVCQKGQCRQIKVGGEEAGPFCISQK